MRRTLVELIASLAGFGLDTRSKVSIAALSEERVLVSGPSNRRGFGPIVEGDGDEEAQAV